MKKKKPLNPLILLAVALVLMSSGDTLVALALHVNVWLLGAGIDCLALGVIELFDGVRRLS